MAQFVDEARAEHCVEAFGDGGMQRRPVGWHDRNRDHRAERAGGRARALQRRQRLAGDLEDFQRALDSLGIGRIETRGRCRIDPRQRRMQRRPPFDGRARVDPRAHLRVGARQCAQPLGQRLEVQHRAADKERHVSAGADLAGRRQRIGAKPRRRIGFGRIHDIDQVMRHAGARRRVRFRGADIHAAVDLCGVDADDLDVEALGQCKRERALARRRRAHQQHRRNHQRPRMKRRSSSGNASWYHVGRPWLH